MRNHFNNTLLHIGGSVIRPPRKKENQAVATAPNLLPLFTGSIDIMAEQTGIVTQPKHRSGIATHYPSHFIRP